MITPTECYNDIEKLLVDDVTNIKENRNFDFTFEGTTYQATVFNYSLQVPCITASRRSVNTDVLLVIMNTLNADIMSVDTDGTHKYHARCVEENKIDEKPTRFKKALKQVAIASACVGIGMGIKYAINRVTG